MTLRMTFRVALLLASLAWSWAWVSAIRAQDTLRPGVQAYLQERVAAHPRDASAWRMLGAWQLQAGDPFAAREALTWAVELDPHSAAAHFDLARCLLELGQPRAAAWHLRQAEQLAPDTAYAQQASRLLARPELAAEVVPASYDVRRFDGSDVRQELADMATAAAAPSAWYLKLDVGAVYNSNVALTPISRDFSAPGRASAQAFVNPTLEYRLFNSERWSAGPSLIGYFSVNEDDAFSDLNLQSYQPGWFVERTLDRDQALLVAKLQYDFTLDQFDGVTFGNRHAATASLTSLWDRGDVSVWYWSTDHTDFRDDGLDPAVSSRDGWTHSLGGSHQLPVEWVCVSALLLGGELQWADVDGDDFAYFGGTLYAGLEVTLCDWLWCDVEGGWGLRDYYASTLPVPRDETLWRASAKINARLSDRWTLSGVFNYDRFDTPNPLFAADRYLAGLVTTFEY